MAEDITIPDPTVVLELLTAFRESKAMFAAVSLGVFDALADGPKSAATLAKTIGTNRNSLERLLDACVGLQLLSRCADGNPTEERVGTQRVPYAANLYANTPAAATYLTRNSPRRLTGY